jgi:hypothetical protein
MPRDAASAAEQGRADDEQRLADLGSACAREYATLRSWVYSKKTYTEAPLYARMQDAELRALLAVEVAENDAQRVAHANDQSKTEKRVAAKRRSWLVWHASW